MSMSKIETLSEKYSASLNTLATRVATLNAEIDALHQAARSEIDKLVKACKSSRSKLHEVITANPGLFEKPRTQTFSGIKVGFAKGKDTLSFDPEQTCELIARKLPDQKQLLVKTTESPIASSLKALDEKTLKSIGVTVTEGCDEVVLKPVDTAVNKVVTALLSE